jgi:hypothetical protein
MLREVIRIREQAYATRRRPEIGIDVFQLASAMAALGRHKDSKDILEEVLSLHVWYTLQHERVEDDEQPCQCCGYTG